MEHSNSTKAYIQIVFNILRTEIIIAGFLMLILGVLEGVGIMMLIPMLSIIGIQGQQTSQNSFVYFISSLFDSFGLSLNLGSILVFYILLVSIREVLLRFQSLHGMKIKHKIVNHLQKQLFTSITYSKWLFLLRKRTSDIIQVLTMDINRVGSSADIFLGTLTTSIVALVYVIIATQLSITLTFITCCCGGILLLINRKSHTVSLKHGYQLTNRSKALYSIIVEHLNGLKLIKSFGKESQYVQSFSSLVKDISISRMEFKKKHSASKMIFSIGSVILLCIILFVSVEIIKIEMGSLLLLIYLFSRLSPKISQVQQNIQSLQNNYPAYESFVRNYNEALRAVDNSAVNSGSSIQFKHSIQFSNVSFGYEKQTKVLKNVNLEIKSGRTTAIVGISGSGKSTLADILMGLLQPDSGIIEIDRKELTTNNVSDWRKKIGYVPQDTFLFHDTLKNNLRWSRSNASEKEMLDVLEYASASEFVNRLPQTMETIIGDRGICLSGGERQRIALARALLSNPSLLILDEATSALDSENEIRIQKAVERLQGTLTIVVITHRLSTIRHADYIAVLDDGQVIETGTWDDLIENPNGVLKKMVLTQQLLKETTLRQTYLN